MQIFVSELVRRVLTRGVSSVKGGSAGEKFSQLVKIKFGFLFSAENFSEMSFLLQEISLFTLVLRSNR